ncbi:MAG: TIGR04086 family membrane protein [Firmicutes bacterium]|nr:TIGR04086 family membrane protein [Bacillota bacterium]
MAKFFSVTRGVLAGILFAVLLGVIVGLLIHLTTMPELSSNWGYASLALVIFMGAGFAAYREGKNGLLMGLEVAVVFIALLLIVNLIFYPGQLMWKDTIIKTAVSLAAGIAGGAIGVAVKSR